MKKDKSATNNKTAAWVGVGIGVVVAGALAFAFSSGSPSNLAKPAFGEVSVEGQALPPFVDPASDQAIGMVAPVLTGTSPDGETVRIASDGQPTIVAFVAHWCSFCQADVPRLQAWLNAGGGEPGVKLLSVATGTSETRPNFPPSEWLEREGWTAPIMLDDRNAPGGEAFGLSAYPYWAVIAPDGTIALRLSGELGEPGFEALFSFAAGLSAAR